MYLIARTFAQGKKRGGVRISSVSSRSDAITLLPQRHSI
jgi:hypothetical protein